MKQYLTYLMVLMLLSAALITPPMHCHGDHCGVEMANAMLDHNHGDDHDHDHEAAANSGTDSKDMSKSGLHGWHAHHADASIIQKWSFAMQPVLQSSVLVMDAPALVSQTIPPLLEPPSRA